MAVHFFIPDQMDAWARLDKAMFAKRSGWSAESLESLFQGGIIGIHEMATEQGPFGYLVLGVLDTDQGKWLQVYWCETHPVRALRDNDDWLWHAARYLEWVATQYDCKEVRIAVNEDHPSRRWLRRLKGVGFAPRMTELAIAVGVS